MLPGTVTSDTDLVAELLARRPRRPAGRATSADALFDVLPRLEGAFSLVLIDAGRIIGVRDPNGFRPLCLGELDGGWVLASESPALDIVGAHFVRELEPGEMVVIDASGPRSIRPFADTPHRPPPVPVRVRLLRPARRRALRPQRARRPASRMGEQLAEQAPLPPDRDARAAGHGHAGARVGRARRAGLRPRSRASRTATGW